MNVRTALVCAAFALFGISGCHHRVEPTVVGSDDEQMDQYSARLEELKTRGETGTEACDQTCADAKEVCDISKKVCEIASRQPDRLQDKCVAAQEQCASTNDRCSHCSP